MLWPRLGRAVEFASERVAQRCHKRRKKPEVVRTPPELVAEWRAVASLLYLGAEVGARIGVMIAPPLDELIERTLAAVPPAAEAATVADDGPVPAAHLEMVALCDR